MLQDKYYSSDSWKCIIRLDFDKFLIRIIHKYLSRLVSRLSPLTIVDMWNMIYIVCHNVALLLHPLYILPRMAYSNHSASLSHRITLNLKSKPSRTSTSLWSSIIHRKLARKKIRMEHFLYDCSMSFLFMKIQFSCIFLDNKNNDNKDLFLKIDFKKWTKWVEKKSKNMGNYNFDLNIMNGIAMI